MAAACAAVVACAGPAAAQDGEPLLQAGEAYATRFSGISSENGRVVIYTEGVVGSIVDLRTPARALGGRHWLDEPQRHPVTAAEVGQVFGVALDAETSPNVFLSATSAFGLHRSPDNRDWMDGMWGTGGGPGTVYRLNKDNGYAPEPFATIALAGRANGGAALGNIAHDRWNNQLYVSDLETGMIHRLDARTGQDLGHYDHGLDGRGNFQDVEQSASMSLDAVPFDPASRPQIDDCAAGEFTQTPECWNFADFRRRVWGLGVRQDRDSGDVRLYYAVWASQGFGNPEWEGAEDDQRNSVWSVRIGDDGGFDTASVRREFFLPDFFVSPEDIARAGYSHPVADIAFPKCAEQNIMLVSERGGVRNLGLAAENSFAHPHESRVIRYELGEDGAWRPAGRYDVGFYERALQGPPFLRANSAGGVDFGLGYTPEWIADEEQPNQTVWMSGDVLCSDLPNGACVSATGAHDDTSQVHGLQGTPQQAYAEGAPAPAFQLVAEGTLVTAPEGPDQSVMIDLDINVDENGQPIEQELARNDATTIGDIEICVPCTVAVEPAEPAESIEPAAAPPVPVHSIAMTHRRWGSPEHSPGSTHRRWGSPEHGPRATHRRWGSPEHTRRATHRRWGSPEHGPRATHRRWGSPEHTPGATHRRWGSPEHTPRATHRRWGSPEHGPRETHRRWGSPEHTPRATHRRWGSPEHSQRETHRRRGSDEHSQRASHRRHGSDEHGQRASHRRQGSDEHTPRASHRRQGSDEHTPRASHRRQGSDQHGQRETHRRRGSDEHGQRASHRRQGSDDHTPRASHRRQGSGDQHGQQSSHRRQGSGDQHGQRASHRRQGSGDQHGQQSSHRRQGSGGDQHGQRASHRRQGSGDQHGQQSSHRRQGSGGDQHGQRASHRRQGSGDQHGQQSSHRRQGSGGDQHGQRASHRRQGSGDQHGQQSSHRRQGSGGDQHGQRASHRRQGSGDQHGQQSSHRRQGSGDQHGQRASHRRQGSGGDQHGQRASHSRQGSGGGDQHGQRASHRRQGSGGDGGQHGQRSSHRRQGSQQQQQPQVEQSF